MQIEAAVAASVSEVKEDSVTETRAVDVKVEVLETEAAAEASDTKNAEVKTGAIM